MDTFRTISLQTQMLTGSSPNCAVVIAFPITYNGGLLAAASKLDPSSGHLLDAGVQLLSHGTPWRAASYLEQALRVDGENPDVRVSLGWCQFAFTAKGLIATKTLNSRRKWARCDSACTVMCLNLLRSPLNLWLNAKHASRHEKNQRSLLRPETRSGFQDRDGRCGGAID
jgi:hypothetical protein